MAISGKTIQKVIRKQMSLKKENRKPVSISSLLLLPRKSRDSRDPEADASPGMMILS